MASWLRPLVKRKLPIQILIGQDPCGPDGTKSFVHFSIINADGTITLEDTIPTRLKNMPETIIQEIAPKMYEAVQLNNFSYQLKNGKALENHEDIRACAFLETNAVWLLQAEVARLAQPHMT